MQRRTVYRGMLPYEVDILWAQRFGYEALGLALLDLLGSATVFGGLGCSATTPASLAVKIAPGRIYSKKNLDDADWGKLAGTGGLDADINADHQIIKQGLLRDALTIPLAPPVTAGQTIRYLIQAQLQSADSTVVNTQFWNAANPNAPITDDVSLFRNDKCVVVAKAGVAATTGSEVSPTADAGWIPLWIVKVAYGAATIAGADITAAAGAPVIAIGGGGGGGGSALPNWQPVNTAYTINTVLKDRLICDTTAAAFPLTLPAAPAFGEECWIIGNFATHNLTILRNGKTIDGAASDFVLNKDFTAVHLVYGGSNNWWLVNG